MNKKKRNLRLWVTALCAAALCLIGGQPAWGQDPTTYEVTRTARSNTEFKFTMPANNVEVTVEYVDAGVKITNGETTLYYEKLADVFANADNYAAGDVIKLLADEELTTSITISKGVTLDLNGKTISKGGSAENLTGLYVTKDGESVGSLTITGSGTISGFGTAIKLDGDAAGTLTLNSLPTFTGNTIDIALESADRVITIGEGFPNAVPENYTPIKVKAVETNPVTITSGFGSGRGNPEQFFASYATNRTIRLNASNEAEMVNYTELTTIPDIANGGTDHDGSRSATADDVWIGDVLTTSTTATPGVDIKWYYADDIENGQPKEGATPLTAEADPADGSKYIVKTADLGKQIVAVFTQKKDIAGVGHPAETIVKVTAPTGTVVKKDNFGELADASIDTEDIESVDYVDYISVNVNNAPENVEYIVVPSDVTPTEQHWSNATRGTGSDLTISQYAAIEGEEEVMKDMMPGSEYKLYYRLVETEDTKHGTTSTDNGKPQNEKNVAIKTKPFDRKVTIDGVTYLIEDDTDDASTPATAKIIGLPSEDDANHTGHKTAHVCPTIEKSKIDSHVLDVFNVIGYTINDPTHVTDVDWGMNISSVGSTVEGYGYLTVDQEDLYDNLLENGTPEPTKSSSPEGYQIYNWNSGEAYFVLGKTVDGGKVVYEQAKKNKGLDDRLTAALNEVYEGGVVKFYDLNDEELPQGTGANKDKPVAAPGQTVKAVIQLPEGFTFKSGANVIKVGDTEVTLTAGTDPYAGKYVGTFTMPSNTTTPVTFKETEFIEGEVVTYTYTAPTATEGVTVTAADDNPTTVRKYSSKLVYTIEPKHHGTDYYALTSLGLTDGVTATIVDAADGTTPVTLPTEQKVKVTLNIPAGFQGNAVTFAPVVSVCAKDIAIKANATITYFDTDGLKLAVANDALTFLTVSAISGSTVTLTEITDKQIPANTPFFITNTSDATSVRMEIDNELATINFDSRFKGTAIAGTMSFAEGMKYYGFDGKNFVWLKEGGSVEAHRCWLELGGAAAGAPSLNILWPDGNVTGINLIPTLSEGEGDWYDLNGRKLQGRPTKKGVYILNGQKVVIK